MPTKMKLVELVERLETFDTDHTIFLDLSPGLTPDTLAMIAELDEDGEPPAEVAGFGEFMDVWHAIDVIRGKCSLIGLADASTMKKTELLIEYAENDA